MSQEPHLSFFGTPAGKVAGYLPAKIYEGGVRLRHLFYRRGILKAHRLPEPVISIGNLTVGGTGKTPMVELTARLLQMQEERPVVLLRGYRGKPPQDVNLVSDGERILLGPEQAGEEAVLLAENLRGVPVIVGKDRAHCGRWAVRRFAPCVLVLDDGYQHLRLDRDLNVLLLDATDTFGGARMLPLGRLREPLEALQRAEVILVTRADRPFDDPFVRKVVRHFNKSAPLMYAYHEVTAACDLEGKATVPLTQLVGKPVAALAGIGKPGLFFEDLAHYQIPVMKEFVFPDHHFYNEVELARCVREAREARAKALITTQKDAIKLRRLPRDPFPIYFLKIEAKLEKEVHYRSYLLRAILDRRGDSNPKPKT